MKFLFINQHASAPAFGVPYRNYYLANELVKDGHEVMMLQVTVIFNKKTLLKMNVVMDCF